MRGPQPGIFGEGTQAHIHLEWNVRAGQDDDAIRTALRLALGLSEETVTVGGANVVIGFGPTLWSRLSTVTPPELGPFTELGSGARVAPSTQHDIWLWLHGSTFDVLFDNARAATCALAQVADLVLEQQGSRYMDSRDITGFIDGTENPKSWEAYDVALLPDGVPGAGGAYAMTQRWMHDLDRFHALTVSDQQDVFGRTKPDSIEFDDDVKPPTAHIARVVIEEDGEELEIYRRSVPILGVAEHGLHFVAFSAERRRFDLMLARMFGIDGDGLHDRLTDFSHPVTGSFWFVPALDDLEAALGPLPQ
jgi:putative iron-dependent peroxidase